MGVFDIFRISYSDYLQDLQPAEVASFYRRLAKKIESIVGIGNSLASKSLLHWLDGKGALLEFDGKYLKDMSQINEYLSSQVRPVFLTINQAKHNKGKASFWGGIVPRLKRTGKYKEADPKDAQGNFPMMYEGPFVEPVDKDDFVTIMDKYKNTGNITDAEKRNIDIFTSLHAFGIQTDVIVKATPQNAQFVTNTTTIVQPTKFLIEFLSWKSHAVDYYNWNGGLGFPVPNPDYQSAETNAIAPANDIIVVYHKNALRVENAGLAKPYTITSSYWEVNDPKICAPYTVTMGT